MKDFSAVEALPVSEYTKELYKLLDSGKFRFALLRVPETMALPEIESFQTDSSTGRICSANFKTPLVAHESLRLEILKEVNYSLVAPDSETGTFKSFLQSIEGWNVVKSLVKGDSSQYDLACDNVSGIPQLPSVPQPSVVIGKLEQLIATVPEAILFKPDDSEDKKKKKRKIQK